jgi:hypothetical protein
MESADVTMQVSITVFFVYTCSKVPEELRKYVADSSSALGSFLKQIGGNRPV